MSKFEWMELETLSNEIAHTQSRLDAARATKNLGLVQLLEREIADAAKRRAQVLSDITNGLGVRRAARPKPQLVTVAAHQPEQPVAQQLPSAPVVPQQSAERVKPPSLNEPPTNPDETNGVTAMWDKLTATDLDRVKRGLTTRRSEMLARHAEELRALEAEQTEIDVIEKAIAAFTQKFKLTSSAEVVPLEGERIPVQAG
jgi:hypothetical protein